MTSPGNLPADQWRAKPEAAIRVDIVIPVLNEAHVLERSTRTLHRFFEGAIPFDWRLVIAENGSTDGTAKVAEGLASELSRVDLLVIGQRGRGRARTSSATRTSICRPISRPFRGCFGP